MHSGNTNTATAHSHKAPHTSHGMNKMLQPCLQGYSLRATTLLLSRQAAKEGSLTSTRTHYMITTCAGGLTAESQDPWR